MKEKLSAKDFRFAMLAGETIAAFALLIPLSFFGNYFGCRRFIFRIDLSP